MGLEFKGLNVGKLKIAVEIKNFVALFTVLALLLAGIGIFFTFAFLLPTNPATGGSSSNASFVPIYFGALIPIIVARRKKKKQKFETLTQGQKKIMIGLLIVIAIMSLAIVVTLFLNWSAPIWPKLGIIIALLLLGFVAFMVRKIIKTK